MSAEIAVARPWPLRLTLAAQVLAALGLFGAFFPLGLTAVIASVIGVSHGSVLDFAISAGLGSISVVSPVQTGLALAVAWGVARRRRWAWPLGLGLVGLLLASIALRLLLGETPAAAIGYDASHSFDPIALPFLLVPNLVTPSGLLLVSVPVSMAVAAFVGWALLTTRRAATPDALLAPLAGIPVTRRRPRRVTVVAIVLVILGLNALAPSLVWLTRAVAAAGGGGPTLDAGLVVGLASTLAATVALGTAWACLRLSRFALVFAPGASLVAGVWVGSWALVVALLVLSNEWPPLFSAPSIAVLLMAVVATPYALWALLSARRSFDETGPAEPTPESAPEATTSPSPFGPRPPSRRDSVIAGSLVVGALVVVVAALVFVARPNGPADGATLPGGPVGGTTDPIDEAPLSPRLSPNAVWTGEDLIVWGGAEVPDAPDAVGRFVADGAAYAPAIGEWRSLAESPLSGRTAALAVWTGSEVVLWGGRGPGGFLADGAAYDPRRDAWRTIGAGPLSPRDAVAAAWTGSELVIYGGQTSTEREVPAQDGAAYDPLTDRWRSLPPVPVPEAWYHHLVWTGQEAVLFADIPMAEGGPPVHVAAWDPRSNAWRVPPAPPVGFLNAALPPLWTGDRILTIAPHTFESQHDIGTDRSSVPLPAGAYDPVTGTWEPAPYPPFELAYHAPAVWTGQEAWLPSADPGSIAAYDPTSATWRAFLVELGSPRFGPTIVWTGDALLIWGGLEDRGDHVARPQMDGILYLPDLAGEAVE